MNFKLLISLILLAVFINQAHAFVSVGDDMDCDYSDLQLAIDSNEAELRLSRQTAFLGNYTIMSQNINLIGGYDDCSAANQNIHNEANVSEIISNSVGNIITINGGGVANDIKLSNLNINSSTDGSGVFITGVQGLIELNQSIIQNNHANNGGGIYLSGAGNELILKNSQVKNNQANAIGGGIYCLDASLKLDSKSLVANNQVFGINAFGIGGGMYAYNCQIEIYSGNSDGESAGFIANQSTREGAGIYARNSQLLINGQQDLVNLSSLGDSAHPVLFKNNISDSDMDGTGYGAAIYLRTSTATIQAAWFDGNKPSNEGSYNLGSVIFAKYSSEFTMGRDESQPCWRQGMCNLVSNNEHVAIVVGQSPTSATITNTEFTNNTANLTSLILVNNSTSFDVGNDLSLHFEGNLVHHNVSSRVGLIKSNSNVTEHCCIMTINVINNTITDNQFTNEIFNINDDTIFNMHGNIVYEDVTLNPVVDIFNSAYSEANISCLMAHDVSSLPNITLNTVVDNPIFVDAQNFDYHLSIESPAIDFCDSSLYTPTTLDIDLQARGRDEMSITDFDGVIDLGMDEYYIADTLFKNGFE
jgi:hypothetical protein